MPEVPPGVWEEDTADCILKQFTGQTVAETATYTGLRTAAEWGQAGLRADRRGRPPGSSTY